MPKGGVRAGSGRKSELTNEVVAQCVELYLAGASDRDVAAALNRSPTTIQNWKKKKMFAPAIAAKGKVNSGIVAKLKKRAEGFTFTETTEKFDAEGNLIGVEVKTKALAPDVAAQKFWLTNRNPDEWANKEVVEHYDGEKGIEAINKGRQRVADAKKRREEENAGHGDD